MASSPIKNDMFWMQEALNLARSSENIADPNPHVGCVIVSEGEIVGSGATQNAGGAHAEVVALQEAGDQAKGASMYVTLEPCFHQGKTPPCTNAIIAAKLVKVFVASEDPNPLVAGQGLAALNKAGIKTSVGLHSEQAQQLNRGFMQRMRTGLPFVTAKMGVSVDGRSAIADGSSHWISNSESREDAHAYRASMSAILSTANTVIADNPRLTARKGDDLYKRQPMRVILDPQLKISNSALVFQEPGKCLLIVSGEKLVQAEELYSDKKNVEVISKPVVSNQFDMQAIMHELGKREINNVLLEAGANFQGACINAGLVDELRVYVAPYLLGDSKFGILQLPGIDKMQSRLDLTLVDLQRFGDDVRLTYSIK